MYHMNHVQSVYLHVYTCLRSEVYGDIPSGQRHLLAMVYILHVHICRSFLINRSVYWNTTKPPAPVHCAVSSLK